jgi:hypothetical protein
MQSSAFDTHDASPPPRHSIQLPLRRRQARPRFHLDGIEAERWLSVLRIGPGTGKKLGLLATVTEGQGGWADLKEPITLRAGEVFVAVPNPNY